MESSEYRGRFNARWMSFVEVAEKFIPIPHFQRLVHSTHSVLLGPRGCGKTTLLKMLARPALQAWDKCRRKDYRGIDFEYPDFEAVYIPSDVKWLYELQELPNQPVLEEDKKKGVLVQRVMISINVCAAMIDTLVEMSFSETDEVALCKAFIEDWKLEPTVPVFTHVRWSLHKKVANIRGALNYHNSTKIDAVMEQIPPSFYGHALDIPILNCNVVEALVGNKLQHKKWAICFDELEISPQWLRVEAFESLRSTDQRVLLKVTCSPLLPSGLKSGPERGEDYKPIRLYYSHVNEAASFCEDLSDSFLKSSFKNSQLTPRIFFSESRLKHEDLSEGEKADSRSYERNSFFYSEIKKLAAEDESLRRLLIDNEIDPRDPYTSNNSLKDELLRKIKPFVLLRSAFLKQDASFRSRKITDLYAGRQAVYAMSEANPRWLLGLLNDLYDKWKAAPIYDELGAPYLIYDEQAIVLDGAAKRYQAYLAATASKVSFDGRLPHNSLLDFIEKIGLAFTQPIYDSKKFPVDPMGSFVLEEGASPSLRETIEKALEVGALVFVGKSSDDMPRKVEGSRFRLTFMLSPIYKLPFRNYPATTLKNLLSKASNLQQDLFESTPSNKEIKDDNIKH